MLYHIDPLDIMLLFIYLSDTVVLDIRLLVIRLSDTFVLEIILF